MKQSEAVNMLKAIMHTLQKVRSNAFYELGYGKDEEMTAALKDLMPRTFDDKRAILPHVIRVLDKYERNQRLEPLDFYNIIALVNLEPAIAIYAQALDDTTVPEPDMHWLVGWSPE